MFLCIYICLFAYACSSSLHVAIRSRFISELRGIDNQALAIKCSHSSSSTRSKTLSICLVKASVLWPIMSYLLYKSLSRITQLKPKDWLALYLPCSWLPFGLLWLASCNCFTLINEHDVITYDTMMLSRWWSCDTLGTQAVSMRVEWDNLAN